MLLRVAPTATHTKKNNKSAYGRNCTQKAVIQRGVAPAILPLADFFSRRRSTDILITKSRMVLGVFAIRMKFPIGGYVFPIHHDLAPNWEFHSGRRLPCNFASAPDFTSVDGRQL